jgi:hypothetical protein
MDAERVRSRPDAGSSESPAPRRLRTAWFLTGLAASFPLLFVPGSVGLPCLLLLLGVVGGARLLRGPGVRPLAFAAGALLLPIAVFAVLLWPTVTERLNRTSFDPVTWKSWDSRDRSPDAARIRMVDDLLERHPLHGLGRDAILGLLGPDDKAGIGRGYFSDYDLVYWLGPNRGFIGMDSEWLVIRFGPDGRVAEHRLVQD